MENLIEKLTPDNINGEVKNIVIETKEELTPTQLALIESIKKLKNPFAMIGIDYVMKDLDICKTVVYKVFQREDFPSINIGKEHKVMLLPYLLWKMNKRG